MYGDTSGTTLEEVNENINDSTIKTYLENWYQEHLSNYASYIADSGFCNDRTLSTTYNNGDGVNTDRTTYYASFQRHYDANSLTLVCPNASNDLFTVTNESGNQAASSPIGLITMDELVYAGFRNGFINKLTYAYSNSGYLTFSPRLFSVANNRANIFVLGGDGNLGDASSADSIGIRPVINLNANVEITGGIGTKSEPFVVKTI